MMLLQQRQPLTPEEKAKEDGMGTRQGGRMRKGRRGNRLKAVLRSYPRESISYGNKTEPHHLSSEAPLSLMWWSMLVILAPVEPKQGRRISEFQISLDCMRPCLSKAASQSVSQSVNQSIINTAPGHATCMSMTFSHTHVPCRNFHSGVSLEGDSSPRQNTTSRRKAVS